MTRPKTADDWVREYFALRAGNGQAKGLNMNLEAYPASECANTRCRSKKKPQLSESKKKGTRLTCVECGRNWKMQKGRDATVGTSSRSKDAPAEADLISQSDLGLALKRLSLWNRRVIVLFAMWRNMGKHYLEIESVLAMTARQVKAFRDAILLEPCVRRDDDVARIAAAVWPRKVDGWSRYVVRDHLDGRTRRSCSARGELESILDLKGMM